MNLAPTQHKNNTLHHDLVIHILLNLPAKSLFRFKLLSNFWHDQISNPYFHDMYHKQAKKNLNFLFCRNIFPCTDENGAENKTENEWKSFNTKTRLVNDAFTTMGKVLSIKTVTCQSMVCFLSTKDDKNIHVSLYCFRTKKLIVLPMDPSSGFYKGIILGFGIGYISSTKTYKVALLYIPNNHTNQMLPSFNCQIIEVSNSHDGDGNRNYSNWRKIEENFHDYVNNFHPPLSIGNTTYWKAFNHAYILSFDFENENFGIKKYPNELDFSFNETNNMFLLDLNGKLGLAEVCSKSHESYFTMVIWNLHDHGTNNWEKLYRFSLNVTKVNFMRGLSCMYLQDEEIIISTKGCLIVYNLKKNTYKILDTNVSTNHSLVGMYHENLYI